MKLKKLFIIMIAAILGSSGSAAYSADNKFLSEAAKMVWEKYPEMFDATKEIPPKLMEKNDAVILAELNYLFMDFEYAQDATTRTFTRWFSIDRRMVKLNNERAVEEFSKHEFGHKEKASIDWYQFAGMEIGFGAKIHKPDGRVIPVDLSDAYDITEGKNDNKRNRIKKKIDISGLETGDVLDYFTIRREWVQEFDPPAFQYMINEKYPIMNLRIECNISPEITLDYKNYNGAPPFIQITTNKGRTILSQTFKDVPVIPNSLFIKDKRQLPFYYVRPLNCRSKIRRDFVERSAGVNGNLHPSFFFNQIAQRIAKVDFSNYEIRGKIMNLIKDYAKTKPDLTQKELLDIACLATLYVNVTDKKGRYDDFETALILADIVKKSPIDAKDASIAFINSRDNVPTKEICGWDMTSYGIKTGDNLYIIDTPAYLVPGEIPSVFYGEEGAAYPSDPQLIKPMSTPSLFKLPPNTSNDNTSVVNCEISICDGDNISVTGDISLKGDSKSLCSKFNGTMDILRETEKFFNLPDKKIFKPQKPIESSEIAIERINDAEKQLSSFLFSDADFNISQHKIVQRGLTPDNKIFKLEYNAKIPSVVSEAGDELIFPIGKFTGSNSRITGNERKRQMDIYLQSPYMERFNLKIKSPEGYKISEESLKAFSKNISNDIGLLIAQAITDQNGDVSVVVQQRFVYPTLDISAWQQMLDILDARADLTEAVIIFQRE